MPVRRFHPPSSGYTSAGASMLCCRLGDVELLADAVLLCFNARASLSNPTDRIYFKITVLVTTGY